LYYLLFFLICVIVYACSKNNTVSPLHLPEPESGPEHFSDVLEPNCDDIDLDNNFCKSDKNELIIGSKNKVLIISCYGYGNMGDNMYSEVFTKYLPECEVVKISDHSVFVDSNKKLVGKPPTNNYLFDYLIIGGGGLITATKLKDSHNMPYYINDAKKRNKPLFIISCGVQGPISNFSIDFALWKDAMNYAKLVTVRSTKDKELLSNIVDKNKIHYFRDLGYVFPHTMRPYKTLNKTVTLIIAGPVHDANQTIKDHIKKTKKDVVIMNMGSLKDDNNNRRMLKMNFPGSNVVKYYGSGKSPEFTTHESFMANQAEMEKLLKLNPEIEGVNPSDLTLSKVINIIYNSDIVFTGRYHGMIFSRSLGVPYDTLGMDTNKVKWEQPITNIKDMVLNSYNHIKLLRKNMGLQDTSVIDIMNLESSIQSL
jgi:polysaccharide pyruvyl transferase WcaK-like protein